MHYNWANSLQQIEPHVIKGLRIAKLIRVGSWVPRARKPARIAVLDKVSEQSRQIGDIWANNSSLTKKKKYDIRIGHSRNRIRLTTRVHEFVGWAISYHSWSELDLDDSVISEKAALMASI